MCTLRNLIIDDALYEISFHSRQSILLNSVELIKLLPLFQCQRINLFYPLLCTWWTVLPSYEITTRYSCVIAMTRTLPLPFFFPEGQMTWLTFDFMPLIEGLNADERTQIPVDNFACLSKPTLALVVLQLRCCLNMTFLTFGPQL